jgi:cation diffusion facilitator family transporter
LLTNFILKITIANYEDATNPRVRTRIGQLEAWVSIVLNGILSAVKLTLGLAINSLSLIADGVHTLSDMVSSCVVLLGFRIAGKPADKEHPFGHGRAEYVATLIIAIMLGVVGFEFIKSAVGRLMEPVAVPAGLGILITIVLTIVAKAWLGQFSLDLGRRIESPTLKADAWHHRSDAISSVLVLAAVGGSALGYPALDGVGGILVGAYLIWSGLAIAREVIDPLMGAPPSPELIKRIRELCRTREHAVDAHDITVHNYGHHMFMTMHVEVSDQLSTGEAHDIAEDVADLMLQELGAYATVHIDPIDTDSELVQKVAHLLNDLLQRSDIFNGFHDLRIVNTPEHSVILFEMTVAPEASESEQQATRRWVQKEIRKAYPEADIDIMVSPLHTYR